MEEIWKDIPGYEGRYQASTMGRIKSLERDISDVLNGKIRKRHYATRILKPGAHPSGHLMVALGANNTQKVHRLVLLTFVGACPNGMEVLHNNGDPTDNRLENLRYGTRRDNILDVLRIGKAWRKLDIKTAGQIKAALKTDSCASRVARQFGVSRSIVKDIKTGRSFAWMPDES